MAVFHQIGSYDPAHTGPLTGHLQAPVPSGNIILVNNGNGKGNGGGNGNGNGNATPEFDASAGVAAIVLLMSVAVVLYNKVRS